jgi:hypothetical protein
MAQEALMIIGLVGLPVLITVIIGVIVFITFGPAIAEWAKQIWEQIKATISEIKETWRSEE